MIPLNLDTFIRMSKNGLFTIYDLMDYHDLRRRNLKMDVKINWRLWKILVTSNESQEISLNL